MANLQLNRVQLSGLAISLVLIVAATVLHNPLGGYIQDDGLYSRIQFLQMLRENFPEYNDLSDQDLLKSVLTKYPPAKTWIREETDGTTPLPITTPTETNLRLTPPQAYYGKQTSRLSRYAIFTWIDEPFEFFGFTVPILLGGVIWFWLFKRAIKRSS